jgi:hypothetical protein
MERRRHPRRRLSFRVGWREPDSEDSRLETTSVLDLSCSGLAILLPRRLERGTALVVEISGIVGRFGEPILLRVENARERDGGLWVTGCSFAREFSEREFNQLLALLAWQALIPGAIPNLPSPATDAAAANGSPGS